MTDQKDRLRPAFEAMLALDGPDRVAVIRHFMGSARKAVPARVEYISTACGCCDCCDCGAP